MSNVIMTSTSASYGEIVKDPLFDSSGGSSMQGLDFGDLETGTRSDIKLLYLRHNGLEPIYKVGCYIRPVGSNWGGYVSSKSESKDPYNPNWFRRGGIDADTSRPTTSTVDYNFLRTLALTDPVMGVRIHTNRNDIEEASDGLGYQNLGLNFQPVELPISALDYSKTANPLRDGYIYPEPLSGDVGQAGDEAQVGVSIFLPEDVVDGGRVQFTLAFKYRYTI